MVEKMNARTLAKLIVQDLGERSEPEYDTPQIDVFHLTRADLLETIEIRLENHIGTRRERTEKRGKKWK